VVAKVFAPQARRERAELIETQSNAPSDLAATLLAKLFTRYPQVKAQVERQAL
jgi:electron transfer flavoprotein beta subunit